MQHVHKLRVSPPLLINRRHKLCPSFKPGQRSLSRSYYDASTRNVPDASGYFANYQRLDTTYSGQHCRNVQPEHYRQSNIAENNMCT